jgi:hypothetical protein
LARICGKAFVSIGILNSLASSSYREGGFNEKSGEGTAISTTEIPHLQGEIDFINSEDMGRQYVVSQATTLAALWPELSYEARQEITKEVVERIDVSKESLHFEIHHISNLNQKDGETLADFPLYHTSAA